MASLMIEFDAIGTRWWIELLGMTRTPTDLVKMLEETAAQFDQRYSRFRDDSLVAELYRTGKLSRPPQEMIEMLAFAKEMYDVSDGAFDIAVGDTLHRLGYGKRAIARPATPQSSVWEHLIITPVEIIYPQGVMLDFGGFGKGWLIELFARDLQLAGVNKFIINGGGDIYVQSHTPVKLALEDPFDETKTVGSVSITRGALACSNTIKRTWQHGTATKHHIIDPRTQDSSNNDIVASFVTAPSALIADTMATILILRPDLEPILSPRYNLHTKLVKKKPRHVGPGAPTS